MRWLAIFWVLGLVSCSSKGPVDVRQYHLRTPDADTGGIASIRAEREMRLHGAVTAEDQRQRLGHYYTIRWDGPAGHEAKPVRLVFRYRQAVTGSEIREIVITAPASRRGRREFQVTGPSYLEGGRVLSWHLSYYRGDDLLETRQSYLWE